MLICFHEQLKLAEKNKIELEQVKATFKIHYSNLVEVYTEMMRNPFNMSARREWQKHADQREAVRDAFRELYVKKENLLSIPEAESRQTVASRPEEVDLNQAMMEDS